MFFTAINQMMAEGVDLTLVIRKANGQLAVSVLPKSNGLKDEAQNHIIPLTLKGLPQELDAGFLQAVARPVQKATGLITNMAQFEAQAEKAAAESKSAKEQKSKETKEEREKREKYEKYFKKAGELIAAGNHKEAVTALGQARPYAKPQDQKKIDEMMEQQKKAMNKGSLFELMDEPAPQAAATTYGSSRTATALSTTASGYGTHGRTTATAFDVATAKTGTTPGPATTAIRAAAFRTTTKLWRSGSHTLAGTGIHA